jgi:hypothetical protein
MELRDAITLLASFNRWRRGEDESLDQPCPRAIGVAIDTVFAAVTEGGTGNSGVERPEPSPHVLARVLGALRERNEARAALDEERTITFRQADAIEELERECDELKKRTPVEDAEWVWQMTDLARKLERERNEARARSFRLEKLEQEWDEERTITFRQADAIEKLECECDDLKKRLNGVLNALNEASTSEVPLTIKASSWSRLAKERDEWRECAEDLALAIRRDDETTNAALEIFDKLKAFERLKEASQ